MQMSISCSLCGMFIPGLCGTVCPLAGLFCGSSGYLCQLATGEEETTMAPTVAPRFWFGSSTVEPVTSFDRDMEMDMEMDMKPMKMKPRKLFGGNPRTEMMHQ